MKKLTRNINRVIKGGFLKSFRMFHIFLPLVLFFTIIITLSSLMLFSYGMANFIINNLNQKLNIVVYFDRRVSQNYIDEIIKNIQERNDVKQIEYISSMQALETFKEEHKDDPLSMNALNEIGVNPFGPSVVVFAKSSSDYENINNALVSINEKYKEESVAPIEDISYQNPKISTAIDKFSKMLEKGKAIFGIIIVFMSIALLFIAYLALRFATQGDREEIKVMKLVGAPNTLILGPTAIMGMFSGFLGAILSLIILYFIALNITPYTMSFYEFNLYNWYTANLQLFFIGNIFFGIFIGFMGSIFAIRRHL